MDDFYKRLVKRDIEKYYIYKESLSSINCQIKELEERKINAGVANYKLNEGRGSGSCGIFSNEELAIINTNAKIDMLKTNRDDAIDHIKRLERAMEGLNFKEKDILISIYGDRSRRNNKLEILTEKYHYEKSHLYRIANRCIEKISYKLYGKA